MALSQAYFRPLVQCGPARPEGALPLAGGWSWWTHAERLTRAGERSVVPAAAVPVAMVERLVAPRASLAGLDFAAPRLMGIVNVTPDSFSDGGDFLQAETAAAHAMTMVAAGADILDIGGESTRPGAKPVPAEEECARVLPVIATVRALDVPISIDTRKARVAAAALGSGADIVNDVSALAYDPHMAHEVSAARAPLCLMHAQGAPETMQDAPHYDDVVLDVYDYLSERIAVAEQAGIPRDRLIVDPGIGFGKTGAHNLALLSRISLFHGLGCALLLGASRKRFIGRLAGDIAAPERVPGSLAVALAAVAQGVQILRVHDIPQTRQAVTAWHAAVSGMHPAVDT